MLAVPVDGRLGAPTQPDLGRPLNRRQLAAWVHGFLGDSRQWGLALFYTGVARSSQGGPACAARHGAASLRRMTTGVLGSEVTQRMLRDVQADGSTQQAFSSYRPLVLALANQFTNPRLLEVGGGRAPLLENKDVLDLGGTYTINDIDAAELALAPASSSHLLGDIADPQLVVDEEAYDLVFSRMVFEHVRNPEMGYRNISRLLAPGGVVVTFIPTLHALPFIVNWLLPEQLGAKILLRLSPNRHKGHTPKFPAFYHWCTATERTRRKIQATGFKKVQIVPFYRHGYYARVPIVRSFYARWWPIPRRHGWRILSAYVFIIAER
jgi:SAM-dependent methyltransferase